MNKKPKAKVEKKKSLDIHAKNPKLSLNKNDYVNILKIVNGSDFKGCDIKYLAFLMTKLEHQIQQG